MAATVGDRGQSSWDSSGVVVSDRGLEGYENGGNVAADQGLIEAATAATPAVFTPRRPAPPQRFFTLQRGRWTVVVPAQQNPPYPHRPRVRAIVIRPRGQQWSPVQPQIPAPPTIPGNRQPAGRRHLPTVRGKQWSAASMIQPVVTLIWPPPRLGTRRLLAALARGKRTPIPADQAAPLPRARAATRPTAAGRRGKRIEIVPPQFNPPYPWMTRVSRLARKMFALQPRGKGPLPAQPQTPVPSKLGAPRRLLNVTARGRQWSAVAMAQPIVTLIWPPPRLGAKRLLAAITRGKRTGIPADQAPAPARARPTRQGAAPARGRRSEPRLAQDSPPRITRTPSKLGGWRRGRLATPTPAQVPVPPTVPGNRWSTARAKIAAIQRGRATNPVLTQASTAPPPWPPTRLGAARRLLSGAQRGRQTLPVQPQRNPPFVAGNQRSTARSRIAALARGRRWTPTPPQQNPPYPWPNRASVLARRLFALTPRGKVRWPVQPQRNPPWPPPKLGAPRQLLSIATRGRRWLPTPGQIAVPKPVFPNRAPAGRRLTALFRGRRSGVPQWPITAVTPKICYPTSALIVPYASGTAIAPHQSVVTHLNTCDD